MSGRRFTYDECGKTIVRGTMDAGINNVIYMELYSGPKMANGRCGKTIDTGTIDRGSAVYIYIYIYNFNQFRKEVKSILLKKLFHMLEELSQAKLV